MTTTTVMIVEDHAATRASLVAKVSADPGFVVAVEAATLQAAQAAFANEHPDVLLVDLELPDGSGIELIEQARDRCHILVISVFGDERSVVSAIRAGAKGYLLKDDEPTEISTAIHQLMDGGSPISPAIAGHLIAYFHKQPKNDAHVALSERELEVLTLASKGYTYAEIAGLIDVSTNTVATYTKRIYTKLEVHSKAQAVYEAKRLGLMDD